MICVGIAADHGGFELKVQLTAALKAAGYAVVDFGAPGQGGGWGDGMGYGYGYGFGWILMIVIAVLVILGVVYMMKRR